MILPHCLLLSRLHCLGQHGWWAWSGQITQFPGSLALPDTMWWRVWTGTAWYPGGHSECLCQSSLITQGPHFFLMSLAVRLDTSWSFSPRRDVLTSQPGHIPPHRLSHFLSHLTDGRKGPFPQGTSWRRQLCLSASEWLVMWETNCSCGHQNSGSVWGLTYVNMDWLAALQMAHPSDATIFCAIYSLPRAGNWRNYFPYTLSIQTGWTWALPSC